MKKVIRLKLAHSIRIGNGEETYLTSDHFDMLIETPLIHIRDKRTKDEVSTSLYNTIWLKIDHTVEEEPKEENDNGSKESKKSSARASKAQSPEA